MSSIIQFNEYWGIDIRLNKETVSKVNTISSNNIIMGKTVETIQVFDQKGDLAFETDKNSKLGHELLYSVSEWLEKGTINV